MTTLSGLYDAMEADDPPGEGVGELGRFVRGEGPPHAPLVLVGERPGDREDQAGRPFVGPAGALLDASLAEAGIDRSQVYVTNAIKRFRFVMKGKRRLHQSPNAGEIDHARWWLTQEIALIRPRAVVTLGATALRVLTGQRVLGLARGKVASFEAAALLPTVHPAFLLRMPDPERRAQEREAFVRDLATVGHLLEG